MAESLPTTPKTSTQPSSQTTQNEPVILQHDVPFPQDIEKSKLDWLLQINEQFFEAELRTVVSNFLPHVSVFNGYLNILDYNNLLTHHFYFQGFSIQNLTPNEAAAVLFRCEERMGKAIPEEDLTAGRLAQYLEPEDYRPIKQVSNPLLYLALIGSCCWSAP